MAGVEEADEEERCAEAEERDDEAELSNVPTSPVTMRPTQSSRRARLNQR